MQLLETLVLQEMDVSEYTAEEIAMMTEYNNELLTARNTKMAMAAQQFLDGGKRVFFVVGAAHMIGDDGIVSLLEYNGYSITVCRQGTDFNGTGTVKVE